MWITYLLEAMLASLTLIAIVVSVWFVCALIYEFASKPPKAVLALLTLITGDDWFDDIDNDADDE